MSSHLIRIWTHNLRGVEYIDSFKPASCPSNSTLQAVRVGAGETGIDVLNQIAERDVVVVTGGNTVRLPILHLYSTRTLTVLGRWPCRMDDGRRPRLSQQHLWYGS